MKKLFLKAKGFTLVETLVAIFILTLVIVVCMGIVQKSLQSANYARDQITAYYLAEEGVEYIRSVRDTNILANASDWLNGLDSCNTGKGASNKCKIDSINKSVTACSGTSCKLNFYQPDTTKAGTYQYCTLGTDCKASLFSRYITVTPSATGNSESTNGNEAVVTATVTWNEGVYGSQSYSVSEIIYNTK